MPLFVDTNVVLYSVSTDPAEAPKRAIADSIFDRRDLVVSAQVLGEFYVQATRPRHSGSLTHQQAADVVMSLGRYPVQPLTEALVTAALALKERYQISYWDAAIVEAARAAGCAEVLSEDLSDGQDYGGIRIRNPFA